MSRRAWMCMLFLAPLLGCQGGSREDAPGKAPPAAAAPGAKPAEAPFDARPFFDNAVMVTDKGAYVHIFWDMRDADSQLKGPERRARLVTAAAQLVLDQFPAGSAAETAKVDIVLVKERNEYGRPKWDSLQKVAHLEGRFARIREAARVNAGLVTAVPEQAFEKIELF